MAISAPKVHIPPPYSLLNSPLLMVRRSRKLTIELPTPTIATENDCGSISIGHSCVCQVPYPLQQVLVSVEVFPLPPLFSISPSHHSIPFLAPSSNYSTVAIFHLYAIPLLRYRTLLIVGAYNIRRCAYDRIWGNEDAEE
jgi:hypothetical protein